MMTPTFPDPRLMAELTVRMLMEIDAIHVRPDAPFTLTSGLASPVYVDCRRLIAYPRIRATLMDFAVATVLREIGFEALDTVAGGETAGIPFAAWIAERLGLPMQYVRKAPKGFGRNARIEGDLADGARALLVEDLATDGGSKIRFCDALREAGAQVGHTLVIFHYDIFPQTKATLAAHDLRLHALATWWDVLAHARASEHFDAATVEQIAQFLHAPLDWSGRHGGATSIAT